MTENITVDMTNLSTTEREQLLALIEKANEPQNKVWKPRKMEKYWYISSAGDIICMKNQLLPSDFDIIALGNYFKTEKEAEFARERLKVIQQLKECGAFYKTKNTTSYELSLNNEGIIRIVPADFRYGILDFETRKAAQKAIETIGAERLKKYYFCIPD